MSGDKKGVVVSQRDEHLGQVLIVPGYREDPASSERYARKYIATQEALAQRNMSSSFLPTQQERLVDRIQELEQAFQSREGQPTGVVAFSWGAAASLNALLKYATATNPHGIVGSLFVVPTVDAYHGFVAQEAEKGGVLIGYDQTKPHTPEEFGRVIRSLRLDHAMRVQALAGDADSIALPDAVQTAFGETHTHIMQGLGHLIKSKKQIVPVTEYIATFFGERFSKN